MPDSHTRFTTVADGVAEGRRLLTAVTDANDYEWQWEVGSWFIALDGLIEATMSADFWLDYTGEKIGVCRLKPDERLRLIVEWLELALSREHQRVREGSHGLKNPSQGAGAGWEPSSCGG